MREMRRRRPQGEDGCSSTAVKCAACGGPYRADYRGCPEYDKLLREMLH